MLPNFRVVTIAVISTFLFAASVGFYTSSRLLNERKPRPESLAAIEENPLNRIALNWPEPVQQPQNQLDLDFAVTAKVLRNPVRDVTDEVVVAPAPEPKVAAAPPAALQNDAVDQPVSQAPIIEAPKVETPKIELPEPEVAQIETPKIDTVTSPPAPAAPQAKPDEEIPTASIVEAPRNDPPAEEIKRGLQPAQDQPAQDQPAPEQPAENQPAQEQPAARIASRPKPDVPETQPNIAVESAPAIKASGRPAAKKAAKKKAAKKVAKPAPRPRPRPAATLTTNSLFPFFGIPQ